MKIELEGHLNYPANCYPVPIGSHRNLDRRPGQWLNPFPPQLEVGLEVELEINDPMELSLQLLFSSWPRR